jgi:hypothetical protein
MGTRTRQRLWNGRFAKIQEEDHKRQYVDRTGDADSH